MNGGSRSSTRAGQFNSSRALDFASHMSERPNVGVSSDHPDCAQAVITAPPDTAPRMSARPQQNGRYSQGGQGQSNQGAGDAGGERMMETLHIERDELIWGAAVGEGLTAQVFCGEWRGQTVAIKKFNLQRHKFTAKQEIALLRETTVAAKVCHDNLVRCYGLAFEKQPFLVITEFCRGGTLFELLHESDLELAMRQKLKMASDVAVAMDYLHNYKPQIIHRDLKSLNLLVHVEVKTDRCVPHVKLSDFGFAKMKDEETEWEKMTAKVGTFHWMAPEVGSGHYDEKADVYSFAMVLFEILCQEVPFEDLDPNEVLSIVNAGERPDMEAVPPDCPALLRNLMVRCWLHLPRDRPSFNYICSALDACGSGLK